MSVSPHVFSVLWQYLTVAADAKWTGHYLRFLAIVLMYGATVHVGNILGLNGQPWMETPLLWRVMDVGLLSFDLCVSVGLWLKQPVAIVVCAVGLLLLQILPYTLFRDAFIQTPTDAQTLNGLVGTELLLLSGLIGLVIAQK